MNQVQPGSVYITAAIVWSPVRSQGALAKRGVAPAWHEDQSVAGSAFCSDLVGDVNRFLSLTGDSADDSLLIAAAGGLDVRAAVRSRGETMLTVIRCRPSSLAADGLRLSSAYLEAP